MWRCRKQWKERQVSQVEQMEKEREEGWREGAKRGSHKRRPSHLRRAEWGLTQIDDPRPLRGCKCIRLQRGTSEFQFHLYE